MTDQQVTGSRQGDEDNGLDVLTKIVFTLRIPILFVLLAATVAMGSQAIQLEFRPGFEKMIPKEHPYIQNFYKHRADVEGANVIQVAVAAEEGTIFDPEYLQTLQEISDEIFLLPGVERAAVKSLWTKNVQWRSVTVDGFEGGLVIPDDYDGSPEAIEKVRENVLRSGQVGTLVANNFESSIIYAPLLEINPETNERLDYWAFSKKVEEIAAQYEDRGVNIHVIGFAKLIGDLMDGMAIVVGFFGIACIITLVLMYIYSRCVQGTLLPIFCSLIAVIWQLGALQMLGFGLDPFNILVPFLVFAIGVSHGVQMLNVVGLEQSSGLKPKPAVKRAFNSVYGAGLAAILSDALGFLLLMLIPIQVIRELGIGATAGILAIIATNLLLLPILLSFFGLSKSGIQHAAHKDANVGPVTNTMSGIVRRVPAFGVITLAALLTAGGLYISQDLKIGDLDQGAPELRPNAKYNQDIRFVVENYSTSSDVMIVMIETGEYECISYSNLDVMDQMQWQLRDVQGVQNVGTANEAGKLMAILLNEGNVRWYALPRDQKMIFSNMYSVEEGVFFNSECNLSLLYVTLDDHKADTLDRVIDKIETFKAGVDPSLDLNILLAAGNAGIAAATNQEIERSQIIMLIAIYSAVTLMVFLTFRSLSAVICIIVPLIITSVLAQALMVFLGIGVKVATLPVIALGVGIGVDYGIYIFNRLYASLKEGEPIGLAYLHTLQGAGKAVVFTGLALAIGAATWIFSPIKFQADMGALLTFMFLWNMIGALTLGPALAFFLVRRKKVEDLPAVNAPAHAPAE